MDCKLNKNAWQKPFSSASDFAIKENQNFEKKNIFFLSIFIKNNY